jgi:DNA polymerase-4
VIACIQIPYFAVAVERNGNATLSDRPVIVSQYTGRTGKVYAACQQTTQSGVYPGMTLSRARGLCPSAYTIPAMPTTYQEALDYLLTLLLEYGNRLEEGPLTDGQVATIYLDMGRLQAAEGLDLAQQVIQALQGQARLDARIGLATGRFPAYVQAVLLEASGVALVHPGSEADFLAPFPVALLPLDKESLRRLHLLGIETLGQYASLPGAAVLAQFGRPGKQAHQLALGRDDRRIPRYTHPRTERITHHFDDAVSNRLLLNGVLSHMVEELGCRLQRGGLSCGEITLTIHLDDGTVSENQTRLSQPTGETGRISREVMRLLDQAALQSPVLSVAIRLVNLAVMTPIQLDLFGHQTGQRDWRQGLGNLIARYGDNCFYQPVLNGYHSYLPERRFRLERVQP